MYVYHIDLINLWFRINVIQDQMEFSIYIFWKNFLWKKERFYSAGYRAQDLSIAGRMLYHLSYGGSTQHFSQKNFSKNIYWKFHLVFNDVNSKSQVHKVDMVEFGYHGEWYTLLIIDRINWNDLENFVNISWYIRSQIGVNRFCEKGCVEPP